ncbi:hypothetical protein [Kineococcus rhizosphaerae]|uniref:DUF1453 domain-containing protein n=1 Tax=Kineococcus rhizosphaerae TaxID=559628 RepID=A0A2T0R230_9ACTN|nr:hypothetical protein [Kineococcus rhizosphaerae]PRY13575.1 hypothetical protein CLV37_108245 [Kineococcus rhizosphaerae]
MSLTTSLLIAVTMVLTTLLADRGVRAVGWGRLLRPLLIGTPIALWFASHVVTHGVGLAVEVAGALAGLVLGLGAVALARVGRDERTGQVVTRAGAGYFTVWIGACVLRFAFSYGAQHWFGQDLGTWLYRHGVALPDIAAVIGNAIVFSVVGMLLARSAGIALKARSARGQEFALAR